jgi:prevent-host-death family protein
MQNISAKDAKYGFGRLIDLARAEPVTVEKHGRPVVVVMAIEEYERLRESANGAAALEVPRAKRLRKSKGSART